jgi:molybdopterin-containing oxidoreductase family iron-sulfur binding subunit
MPQFDRRDFLKIVGMSAGAAATVACKDPVEKVIPYLNQPEEIVPGIATYYHSTCRECPQACAITVKTREGRPIYVSGNAADPAGRGGICVRGQLSLYRTYDASRFRSPMRREGDRLVPVTWDEGLALLAEKLGASGGKVAFLGGAETGVVDDVVGRFLDAVGSTSRLRFELYAYEALRSANRDLFGVASVPTFDLENADFVVAFGTDFLETWGNTVANQAAWARGRAAGRGYSVFVGPRLGISGGSMDRWIAPVPGTEILVALALAHEVANLKGGAPASVRSAVSGFSADAVADATGVAAEKLREVAKAMAAAHAPVALPPGVELQGANATSFAAAVQLLNAASGAINHTVAFGADLNVDSLARFSDVKELAGKMRGGEIGVLMVHEVNPVYAAPQVGFADAVRAGGVFLVSFSSANDETTALADLVLPDHTAYESWGDAEPVKGVRRLQQPTIRPLFDTRAMPEVLIDVAGRLGKGDGFAARDLRGVLAAKWGDASFVSGLEQGGSFAPAPAASVALGEDLRGLSFAPVELGGDAKNPVLVVYPSLHFYDGRSQRIAMLNEVPDPIIKTTWASYAEMHPATAAELGVDLGDEVELATEGGKLLVAVYPHEAVRPGVVAIAVGQGHQPVDPEAPQEHSKWRRWEREQIGVNALQLVPGQLDPRGGGLAWLSTRVAVRKTGAKRLVARTQITFDEERRGISRAIGVAALAGDGGHHGASGHGAAAASSHGDAHAAPLFPIQGDPLHLVTKEYDPANDSHPSSPYRWGLSVDLDKCVGCNACVAACNVENNGIVVGEENVRVGREMHWIRINRFVEVNGDQVHVNHVPLMCQHCGAAPCENVCPAIATYHNPEGLNVMVPNRCIGTRFCANNCPYKARRFNHYPYDFSVREPEHLVLNPDVMVRSKGVMEKCTMCVQRIAAGRELARKQGRLVQDGDITPACAEACPSRAISFGNLKDPASEVTKLRTDPRAYRVLEHLYTRPGVSYLKIIRRESHEA